MCAAPVRFSWHSVAVWAPQIYTFFRFDIFFAIFLTYYQYFSLFIDINSMKW